MSDQGYWEKYEHVSAARRFVGLPYGCDDTDITRAMLRLFRLPVPVAVLGDTAIWFRQLAIEAAGSVRQLPGQRWTRLAAREAISVLPERRSEILRLLKVSDEHRFEDRLTELLERADRNRARTVELLDWETYGTRRVEIAGADLEVDAIPDDPDPLSKY